MKKEKTMRQIENRVHKMWIDENVKCQKLYETFVNEKKADTVRENARKRLAKRLAEYDLTVEEFGKWNDKVIKDFLGE